MTCIRNTWTISAPNADVVVLEDSVAGDQNVAVLVKMLMAWPGSSSCWSRSWCSWSWCCRRSCCQTRSRRQHLQWCFWRSLLESSRSHGTWFLLWTVEINFRRHTEHRGNAIDNFHMFHAAFTLGHNMSHVPDNGRTHAGIK